MANIDIKLSQSVIDTLIDSAKEMTFDSDIGTLVDSAAVAAFALSNAYPYFDSYSLNGATLRLSHGDGAYQIYSGVRFDVPGAYSGSATASEVAFHKAGVMSLSQTGTLNYDYAGNGSSLTISGSAKGSTLTSFRVATDIPANSPDYPPLVGNVSLQFDGSLFVDASRNMNGTITKVGMGAAEFLLSGEIEGVFHVSTNLTTSGQGISNAAVSGILHSYKETYRDGSHAWLTGLGTTLAAKDMIDIGMLADPSRFGGDDTIKIDLPGRMSETVNIASGAGNDSIKLAGGGGQLNADAGSGNDVISIVSGAHQVDGGSGIDQLTLAGARSAYTLQKTASGHTLTDAAGVVNTVLNVERIGFSDTTLALDIEGHGGQAYRLYQAAFNRKPDLGGLGFQMWALDQAGLSLTQVAQGFIDSPEFAATYGKLSNHDFVVQLYANVLHRAPDAGGLKFHVDLLNAGIITRAQDLVGFSESPENKAALVGVIGNGFDYIPYA